MTFFKRTFIVSALSISMIVPMVSLAQDNSALIAQLMAQIQTLQAQIQSLRAQPSDTRWCFTFVNSLKIGDTNPDVAQLVLALNKEGLLSGKTDTLDEEVAAAVTGFQEKHRDEILTPNGLKFGTGYVGKSTRAKLNQLYGCGGGGGVLPPIQQGIVVTYPKPNQVVSSPLTIRGYINGNGWTANEGEAGTVILGNEHAQLTKGILKATSDWMQLPAYFEATLTFEQSGDSTGALVFNNENPSGLAYGDRTFRVPVRFNTGISTNYPPVISGVSGPTSLNVGQQGTWTVKAYDPNNGLLSYAVDWKDNTPYSSGGGGTSAVSPSFSQSASFTHTYNSSGFYNPVFVVTNQSGQSAKTSISVNVGGATTNQKIQVISPNGGETLTRGSNTRILWFMSRISDSPQYVNIYLNFYYPPCSGNICPAYAYRMPYTIATNVPASSGQNLYDWTVGKVQEMVSSEGSISPLAPEGSYYVQICPAGAKESCDQSDSYFKIISSNTIGSVDLVVRNLKSVNAGYDPSMGLNRAAGISYDTCNDGDQSMLSFHYDILVNGVSKNSGTGSNGPLPHTCLNSYTAFSGLDMSPGITYKVTATVGLIGVVEQNITNNSMSGTFTVPGSIPTQSSIRVISPNGGETLQRGSGHAITWAQPTTLLSPLMFDISLIPYQAPCSSQACALLVRMPYTIAKNYYNKESGKGIYQWVVGNVQESYFTIPDGSYVIQVCQSDTSICDKSDSYFKIVTAITTKDLNSDGKVDQYDANYLANVIAGSSACPVEKNCDLDKSGDVNAFDLFEFSFVGSPIDLNGDGKIDFYDRNVLANVIVGSSPCPTGKNCDINGDGTMNVFDLVASLSTTQSSITVLSPNGGEQWQAGSSQLVRWTSFLDVSDSIGIIRLRDSVGAEHTLIQNTLNDGQEMVTLPQSLQPGTYTLEVKSLTSIIGYSAPFSILSATSYDYSAPQEVFPSDGQTLLLDHTYSFEVKPVVGATGYLFGFKQDLNGDGEYNDNQGEMIHENYRDLKTLSSEPVYRYPLSSSKFRAGKMQIWVRAYINNQWTDAQVTTVILASLSWSGYSWGPVYVTYGNDVQNGYGNWYLDNATLKQDQVSSLHYKIIAKSMAPQSDYEVTALINIRSGDEFGICARLDENGNGYCFMKGGNGMNTNIVAFSNNDQNPDVFAAGTAYNTSSGIDYIMKLRVVGQKLLGKIYVASDSEPADWNVTTSDTRFNSGKIGFYSYGSQPSIKSVTVVPIVVGQATPAPSSSYTANALSAIKAALNSVQNIINQMR